MLQNRVVSSSMEELVKLAIQIATSAHDGQFRRDGFTPYIEHPKAVATRVSEDAIEQSVAWLHDTIEDTKETQETLLAQGIPEPVVKSVVRLTKRPDLSYDEYLSSIANDPVARHVKIADMLTNLSDTPTDKQIRKYAKGLLYLLGE